MSIKLIGETAWHHEGDFQFMDNLIDQLISSSVDIIKVHVTIDFDEYMTKEHEHYGLLKRYLFSEKDWIHILEKIKNSDKELMVLVNDRKAIDLVKSYNPTYYEIHAVCLNDIHLLNHLSKSINSEDSIVFGIGGSTVDEIQNAIECVRSNNIILFYGFQNYPTRYGLINFQKLRKYIMMFPEYRFGYADHTGWDHDYNELVTIFGAAMGVEYIEKHVTTEFGQKRTDYSAAISFEMIDNLKNKLNILNECIGDGKFELNAGEMAYSEVGPMKKAPLLNKDVSEGDKLVWENIVFKRTNDISDIKQDQVKHFINKAFNKDLRKGQILNTDLFE